MGLFSSAFGPSDSISRDGWFIRALGGKSVAGPIVTAFSALKIPAVYACINRISNPIARFPLGIYQKDSKGNSVRVTEHPLSDKLGMRPNEFMSSRTLRKTCQAHALGWGNGYMEIERNNKDEAIGLWPLLPWETKPEKRDNKFRIRTNIDGKQFYLDHEDVIHVMDLSQDGYEGLSQIALARNAMGMAVAMEEFGGKFFANDAKSGGFLLHPGKLSATAKANMGDGKKAVGDNPAVSLEKQGGLDNAHRVKVLEEGMKFVQTTIPPEDAQFLGSRDFQIAEIARMYDVPLILLQSQEKSTSWGSGIEQLMIGFVRQTIDPWVAAWEQEFNWKLFTPAQRAAGMFVKFNMNALLRGDMAARAAFYREMFGLAALSPNQICAYEDIDGIGPDGDARFVPAAMTTLERAIAGETKPAAADTTSRPPAAPTAPPPDQEEEA